MPVIERRYVAAGTVLPTLTVTFEDPEVETLVGENPTLTPEG